MEKATIVIDLGNSETRALIETGNFEGKARHTKMITLDNRVANPFRVPPLTEDLLEKYNSNNSLVFEITDAPLNGASISKHVVTGSMARLEHSMTFSSPDVLQPKYRNPFTIYNTVQVLFRALEYIKEASNTSWSLEEIANNLEFEVTLLLPPEQATHQESLKEDFKNLPLIKFLLPEMNIKFNISDVYIQQEGYTAYYGTFFDRRTKTVRSSLTKALMKRILLVDVGEGTTDLMLIDHMQALESSKRTFSIGGSNVRSATRFILSKETGGNYATNQFVESSVTGMLSVGNSTLDICEYINEAKYNVAYKIVEEIKEYLLATQIVPSSINYILVVGGGTMKAENDKISTLGFFINEHFKNLTPETDYIDVNTIDTHMDLFGSDDLFSARNVNLLGAGVLTDMRDLKKLESK